MDKIKVLLIDDEPKSLYLFSDDNKPTINFLETGHVKAQYKELAPLFELEWLQSLNDVKEYRFFNRYIEHNFGKARLQAESFVPDILLFDYNFRVPVHKIQKPELLNYKLAIKLGFKTYLQDHGEDEEARQPTGLSLWQNFVENNAFGCFAGAVIALDFKENACIGLPTTSYTDGGFQGKEQIEYFEDLLQEDFGNSFEIKGRSDPKWRDLLRVAMQMKRNRILQMAAEYSLSFDLQNLLNLKAWRHCKRGEDGKRKESGFILNTQYGCKEFSVDAMFLDKKHILAGYGGAENASDKEFHSERDLAIQEFAEKIFNTWFTNSKDFDTIEKHYHHIWGVYRNEFGNIIDLSELHLRYEYFKQLLSLEDKKKYESLRNEYVDDKTGNFRRDKITSLFEIHHTKLSSTNKRIVLLLLATKATLILQKLRNRNQLPSRLQYELSPEEFGYFFSPIKSEYSNYPLLLSMHVKEAMEKKKETESDEKRYRADSLEKTKSSLESLIIKKTKRVTGLTPEEFFLFDRWITRAEKTFLQAFFFNDLSRLSAVDYPEWLK